MSSTYCAIVKSDNLRPTLSPLRLLLFPGNDAFRYLAYNTHSRIHWTIIVVKRPSQHPPWKSSWTNAYLANFVICSLFPVNLRWHLVHKHRRNVEKPSFRKIPHKTPTHDTLRTAMNNIYGVPCEFVRWLWILVRTKNQPSFIIIRYCPGLASCFFIIVHVSLAYKMVGITIALYNLIFVAFLNSLLSSSFFLSAPITVAIDPTLCWILHEVLRSWPTSLQTHFQ